MEEEKSEAAAKNSAGRRESKRTSETPQGTWLGGTRKGSLWLCYAGPLAKRQKKVGSQVIGEGRSLSLEVEQLGKSGEELATERRREYTHRVRFGRERRASRLPCLSLGLGDD